MAWWSRAPRVPLDVLDQLELEPGERPLASATTYDDSHLVATDRALWVPLRGLHRLGWESVDRAVWNQEEDLLTVVEAAPLGQLPRRHVFHISSPGRLIEVVHERVNATVVLTRFTRVSGEHGIRVIGRRHLGSDGLVWTVSVDRGIDPQDPLTSELIEQTLREARAEVGE